MKRLPQLALVAALALVGGEARAVVLQTLVAEGDPVPGAPGETFVEPHFGSIGPGGTAFTAFDTTGGGTERLWFADVAGNLTPITHEGAAAPGTTGTTFTFLEGNPLAAGVVGVHGGLTGAAIDDSNDEGFWLWDAAGGLQLVARKGDVVPGTNGARLASPIWTWVWTSAGELFASATLVGGDATNASDSVVLRSTPSGTNVFLREGDPAPGIPGLALGFLLARDYGDELLISTRQGFGPQDAIYRMDAAGGFEVVYAAGDPPPGFPEGTFRSIDFAGTAPGQLPGFTGSVTTPSGTYDGIWFLDANGELALAAREFAALHGGFVLRTLNNPVVDGAGRVIFEGNAVDADFDVFSSIHLYDPASRELGFVARVETPIPCLPDASFTAFFRNPFANLRGDIAFWGAIEGVEIPRDSAIYARLPDQTFVVIAREQQSFEVTPGVFKTVRIVSLSNTAARNALSDDGRLNFHLEFTDRTAALLIAHLAEPGDRGLLRASSRSHASERARCAHVAPGMRLR